jgi:hypothetical protein
LKKNNNRLELNGVHQLDDTTLAKIANFNGRKILLNDLETLPDKHAEILCSFKGTLELNGLEIISGTSLEILLGFKGRKLCLNGVKKLPTGFTAPTEPRPYSLSLDGLKDLNELDAIELSKTGNILSMDGLEKASDVALANLLKHRGSISLNGLTTLPPLAAKSFTENHSREYYKTISLNGITALSEQTAQYLGKGKTIGLNLDGITSMDASIAIHFNEFPGDLSLNGLQEIDEKTAGYLIAKQAGHGRSLGSLRKIDDQVAQVFGNMAAGSLKLGITSLSDQGASYLSRMHGHLTLYQLNEISKEGLQILSQKHPLRLSPELFERLPGKCPARWDEKDFSA